MHTKSVLVFVLALGVGGCIKFADDGKDASIGTTTTMAAEALTKAVSFAGGELIDGLMPETSDKTVSLLSDDGGSVEPGQASLMSFDVSPDDSSVDAALVQFEGAGSHFLIDSSAFGGVGDAGTAADGGMGDGGPVQASAAALVRASHIALSYSVAKSACENLCDRTYQISVVQAVRLSSKGVSKHATATLTLDCSASGDHAMCGADGTKAVEHAPATTDDTSGPSDAAVPVDPGVRGDAGAQLATHDGGGTADKTPDAGRLEVPDASAAGGPCAGPAVMTYMDALTKYNSALMTFKPAAADCATIMECVVYRTPFGGECMAISKGYTTTAIDQLDMNRRTALDALTQAELTCVGASVTMSCPDTATATCATNTCVLMP